MSTISKAVRGKVRRHAVADNGKPICGGGHGAKQADYQIDLGDDVDCEPCLTILEKIKLKKAQDLDLIMHPWKAARQSSWRVERIDGVLYLGFSHRFKKGKITWGQHLPNCDEDLAAMIVAGLNAVYPPRKITKRNNSKLTIRFES